MKHRRSPRGKLVIQIINTVGLDRDLRTVPRGKFSVFNQIGLGSVPFDYRKLLILIEHRETEAGHEKIEPVGHAAVKDFWN